MDEHELDSASSFAPECILRGGSLVALRLPQVNRRTLSAVTVTSGTAMVAAVVAFVVNILMARQLGPDARGEVAWALQGAYVVAPLLALGVDRQALREPNRTTAISQWHVWILCIIGVAFSLAFGSASIAACIAVAAVGASLAIERGTGMAAGTLNRFVSLQIAVQAWVLGASTVLFVANVDAPIWWLATYAAPAPFLLFLSLRRAPDVRIEGTVRERLMGTVDRSALGYMVGGFGALMAARVERLILPVLGSTRQLGLYVAIATASEMLVWAARGLGESRVVGFMTGHVTRRSLAKVAAYDLTFFLTLAVPLGLGIRFLLIPLLGPGFSKSDALVIPLCLASASWATYLQLSAVWLARGSVKESMRLDVSAAVLTAVVVSVLIPHYGALGAAVGCFVAYTTMIVAAVAFLPLSDPAEASID